MKKKFKWTDKQVKALEDSIEKWKEVVDNCPCCFRGVHDQR